jgi:hypothetical protein
VTLKELLRPCIIRRAYHDSGPRSKGQIKWIVLHDTEGGTAESVAAMFARPSALASTHLVVDEIECWRMVPDLVIPWGAPGANTGGLHIEQCGFASWSRSQWLAHEKTLRRSAAKAARWSLMYGIPLRWVGKWGLKLGRKGVTTHKDCSLAFPPNDGHHDPGPNFPKDKWMSWAKEYRREILTQAQE